MVLEKAQERRIENEKILLTNVNTLWCLATSFYPCEYTLVFGDLVFESEYSFCCLETSITGKI